MSILTKPLQEEIFVRGKSYPINTDFRVWLEFSELWEDSEASLDTLIKTIKLCFDPEKCRTLPKSPEEMLRAIMEFYSDCSTKKNEKKSSSNNTSKDKIFDFSADADFIYAAFFEQYGIDLLECNMHWHKFLALFHGLSEDCRLLKVMGYRNMDLSDIKDSKLRANYQKLKDAYALPDRRTKEEKEQDFADALFNL